MEPFGELRGAVRDRVWVGRGVSFHQTRLLGSAWAFKQVRGCEVVQKAIWQLYAVPSLSCQRNKTTVIAVGVSEGHGLYSSWLWKRHGGCGWVRWNVAVSRGNMKNCF